MLIKTFKEKKYNVLGIRIFMGSLQDYFVLKDIFYKRKKNDLLSGVIGLRGASREQYSD